MSTSYRGEPLLNDYKRTLRKYGSSITWREDTHGHCYEVASNWVIEHGGIYVIGIVYHRTRAMVHHALVEYEDGPRRYYRDNRLNFVGYIEDSVYDKLFDGFAPVQRLTPQEVAFVIKQTGLYPNPATLLLPPLALLTGDWRSDCAVDFNQIQERCVA